MGALTAIVLWAVGLFVLYWVVRAAVKGGILDADRELSRDSQGWPHQRPGGPPPR